MKICPYCAEEVQDAAVVCKHCGRDVKKDPERAPPDVAPKPKPSVNPVMGVLVLAVGIAVYMLMASRNVAIPGSTASAPTSPSQSTAPPAPTRTPTPPLAATSVPTSWKLVSDWHGSGIKETETFTVRSREWRVEWQTSNEVASGLGFLQIYVYDESGSLVTLAANNQGTGSDTTYVRGTPGRYYLTISGANVDWSVVVEDQR